MSTSTTHHIKVLTRQRTVRIEIGYAIDRQVRIFGVEAVQEHPSLHVRKAAGGDEKRVATVLPPDEVIVEQSSENTLLPRQNHSQTDSAAGFCIEIPSPTKRHATFSSTNTAVVPVASISMVCGLAGMVTTPVLQSTHTPSFSLILIAPQRMPLEKDTILSAVVRQVNRQVQAMSAQRKNCLPT